VKPGAAGEAAGDGDATGIHCQLVTVPVALPRSVVETGCASISQPVRLTLSARPETFVGDVLLVTVTAAGEASVAVPQPLVAVRVNE
jgi:hypothetical protein